MNLDMGSPHAPRMARMALRLYRPFRTTESDPWNIADDEEAVRQLEEFIRDDACPGWLLARYLQHNRAERRKRKGCECGDGVGESSPGTGGSPSCRQPPPEATAADDEDAGDEMDQSGIRRKCEANPPQRNNAHRGGGAVRQKQPCTNPKIGSL